MTVDTSNIASSRAYYLNLEDSLALQEETPSTPGPAACPTTSNLMFSFSENFFLREFALYGGLLTQADVLRLYQQPLAKPKATLLQYYPLEVPTLSSVLNLVNPASSLSLPSNHQDYFLI